MPSVGEQSAAPDGVDAVVAEHEGAEGGGGEQAGEGAVEDVEPAGIGAEGRHDQAVAVGGEAAAAHRAAAAPTTRAQGGGGRRSRRGPRRASARGGRGSRPDGERRRMRLPASVVRLRDRDCRRSRSSRGRPAARRGAARIARQQPRGAAVVVKAVAERDHASPDLQRPMRRARRRQRRRGCRRAGAAGRARAKDEPFSRWRSATTRSRCVGPATARRGERLEDSLAGHGDQRRRQGRSAPWRAGAHQPSPSPLSISIVRGLAEHVRPAPRRRPPPCRSPA